MFQSRIFGSNPSSFKIILEYGKDSFAEQPALLSGGQVRLTKALATLEFEFNSDESEANILERFTQVKSRITFDRLEEKVVLELSQRDKYGIQVKLSSACISPVLRSVQVVRTSSTGTAPEALLTSLFKHCDLSGVWKLRGAEGFGNFWCSCCEVRSWCSLANMNLSSCGITSVPAALSSLVTLRILRLSHNKLTSLPAEISALTALEVLAADHNQLTSIPALRCSSLSYLELEDNRLARPVLDLRALSNLVSLQLYGNPLDYLPELSPATALRSLSLANVRIMADAAYSRWEVEVAPLPYISLGHKLASLFKLTFRSSCQHPLLAGALGRISEDRANCELMSREETAIQQLVLMALSEQPVVAEQACRTLGALAQLGLATARKVLAHDVVSTIKTLLQSSRRTSNLCGLTLLGSLAAASEAVSAELLAPPQMLPLLQACIRADDRDVRIAALTALANLAFCRDNKLKIRAASGLLSTLIELAEAPSTDAAATAAAAGAATCRSSPSDVVALRSADPQHQQLPDGPGLTLLPQAADPDALSPVRQKITESGQSTPIPLPLPLITPVPSVATAAPAVVRMPLRATNAAGGISQRHSDTGGGSSSSGSGGGTLASFWVGSPPGPSGSFMSHAGHGHGPASCQTAPGAPGGRAATGTATSYHSSLGSGLGATSPVDGILSPPQQQVRPVHLASSTSTTVGPSGSVSTMTSRALSPVHITAPSGGASQGVGSGGPLSPTSPTSGEAGSSAATSSLPPQIALAPLRAVPEPVARRDQVRMLAIKVLAILGENDCVRRSIGQPPIVGRGVRVLALDGGGMRGLALVQIMRHIERRTGRPLYQLFDLVVGTSTGAIVAFGLGVFHFTLDQCEAIYTGLGHKVFNQASARPKEELLAAAQAQAAASAAAAASATAGSASGSTTTTTTGWRDSLFRVVRGTSNNLRVAVYGFKHDASTFEELLRQMCDVKKLGCVGNQLIDAAALGSPKVAAVATLVSSCPVTPFLFTSYELPPEVTAAAAAMRACASSSKHLLWQAVRASSAAPYYLDDFVCGDERYQDGAATANNPSILALQQARLLWPGLPLEALVSLGCGAAPPVRRERGAHAVLDTGAVLVDAATSPDRADEALSTLLPLVPGAKYFRFQPVHETCSMELDDVNSQHWAALQAAVDEYCTAHAARLDELVELLLSGRGDGGDLPGGLGQPAGDAAVEDAEPPFEVPAGVGPDGAPLPPVPRVRLGSRCGVVIVEAPRAAPVHHVPVAAAAAGSGDGSVDSYRLHLPPEQLVIEALARRSHTLRRCDLAATASDAALSAALVEAHMRCLEAQQQQEEQQQLRRQEQQRRGDRARSTDSSNFLLEPIAAADEVAEAKESARRTIGDQSPSAAAPSGADASAGVVTATVSAAISGLVSPPRSSNALTRTGVTSVGARQWTSGNSGRSFPSSGGSFSTASVDAGVRCPMDVAGDVVVAEAAAAAAAAEAAGIVTLAEPHRTPPPTMGPVMMPSASSQSPSSVADAAVEAAEAAGGAGSSTSTAGAGTSSSGSTAATTTSAAATATSLLYDFLFSGKRIPSTRGMSMGGAPPTAATAAPTPGATATVPAAAVSSSKPTTTSTSQVSGMTAGETRSQAMAPLPVRPDGTSRSLPLRSPSGTANDAPMSAPSTSATQATTAGPVGDLAKSLESNPTSSGAATAAAAPMTKSRGSAAPRAHRASCGSGASAGAATVSPELHEVQPAVLLAALLQDLQAKCGLLHLGLRPVYDIDVGSGGKHQAREERCGLVARWAEEVVAVVEPGPDADRILSELGHSGESSSSGNRRSLASLFAANNGAPLESGRACSYRLLARQEVWHNGNPLATLLLQVTRPAALLRPSDFAVMTAQLSGLVITAAAPLPLAITTALLHAGAAAIICPRTTLLPAAAATAVAAVLPPPSINLPGGPTQVTATVAAAQGLCMVFPYSAGGVVPRTGKEEMLSVQRSPGQSGGGSEGPVLDMSAGADALTGYYETLVGELVEGATVLGAITVADRQHAALRGRIAFHHL